MREEQTFQGNPVTLPLAPCGRLHFLVLLVHEEVLDGDPAGLPHHPLGDAEQRVGLVGGAHGALLVTEGGACLLQALRLAGAPLQLLAKVLVHALHALAGPAAAAAAAVAAGEHAPAVGRAHGEGGRHGLVASGLVLRLHGHPVDPAVLVLAALPGCDILRCGRSTRQVRRHGSHVFFITMTTTPPPPPSQTTKPSLRMQDGAFLEKQTFLQTLRV